MASLVPTSSDGDGDGHHHVYISFRRGDQSNNIAEMIGLSLGKRGVRTYRDQKHMIPKQNGTVIEKEVREAILDSTISVVLLSKEYLASSWCLEELVRILNCREEKRGMVVLPIFYDVDPSDIRKQRGDAAQELRKQRVGGPWWTRWKNALQIVGGLCGWDHRNANKIESLLVGKVVEDIVNKRFPTNRISIYPLTYDTCDVYLKQFLQMGLDDVLIAGICGQSGMGKTTIAKAVYNQIFNTFDGSSFLKNVGQDSKQPDGLVRLQEKLLYDILSERNTFQVTNATRGMGVIKEKLGFKRVLIVLDDVDDLEQLFALVGNRSWFGSGSKIIITTRNVQLLNVFGVDQIFMAQGRPLPHDIEVIWEQRQQTSRMIVGLKEYMESFSHLTNVYVKYLEDSLLRERRKNAAIQAQVISDSKEAQSPGYASTACIGQDTMMHGNDSHGRSINPNDEDGLEEIITGRVEARKAKFISL